MLITFYTIVIIFFLIFILKEVRNQLYIKQLEELLKKILKELPEEKIKKIIGDERNGN